MYTDDVEKVEIKIGDILYVAKPLYIDSLLITRGIYNGLPAYLHKNPTIKIFSKQSSAELYSHAKL